MSIVISIRKNLRTLIAEWVIQEFQILGERLLQITSWVRVKTAHGLIYKIHIQQTEGCEVSGAGIRSISINPVDIGTRRNGVNVSDFEALNPHRFTGPMEPIRHVHVLEEAASNVKVQLAISLAPIYEEIDGEHRLCISSEKSR